MKVGEVQGGALAAARLSLQGELEAVAHAAHARALDGARGDADVLGRLGIIHRRPVFGLVHGKQDRGMTTFLGGDGAFGENRLERVTLLGGELDDVALGGPGHEHGLADEQTARLSATADSIIMTDH